MEVPTYIVDKVSLTYIVIYVYLQTQYLLKDWNRQLNQNVIKILFSSLLGQSIPSEIYF